MFGLRQPRFYYFVQTSARRSMNRQRLACLPSKSLNLTDQGRDRQRYSTAAVLGRDELAEYAELFLQADTERKKEEEKKVMRRLTQPDCPRKAFTFFTMHRFLDVCLDSSKTVTVSLVAARHTRRKCVTDPQLRLAITESHRHQRLGQS
jgi:hypothetical protein